MPRPSLSPKPEDWEREKKRDGVAAWRIRTAMMKDKDLLKRKPNIVLAAAGETYEAAFGKPSITVIGDKNRPILLEFAVVTTKEQFEQLQDGQYKQLPEGSNTDSSGSTRAEDS